MDERKHTVTIPIADYNELIQAVNLTGLQKIQRTDKLYQAFLNYLEQSSLQNHTKPVDDTNFDIYIRINQK